MYHAYAEEIHLPCIDVYVVSVEQLCQLSVLHLLYELVILFFDFDADGHLWKFLEHVLQQSKLPVCAAAVVTCRSGEVSNTKFTQQLLSYILKRRCC